MNFARLILFAAFSAFLCSVATAQLAEAAGPKGVERKIPGTEKGGARKAPVPSAKDRSATDTRALRRQKVNETRADIRKLERRQEDFISALKLSPSLRTEPAAAAQTNKTMMELETARGQLNILRKQSLNQFASARNIRILPDPPRSAPPQLSAQTLQIPRAEQRPFRSVRPPAPPSGAPPPLPPGQ